MRYVIMLCLIAAGYTNAQPPLPDFCYSYSDIQGCDPFGNYAGYDWQDCPDACNSEFTACENDISWFETKGEDWGYTNAVENKFVSGATWQSNVLESDIYNICTEEGDCNCETRDNPSGPGFIIGCFKEVQYVWEDHTTSLSDTPCPGPYSDPGEPGDGGGVEY